MPSLRHRLILSYLLVVTIGMLIAGTLAWWSVEQLYLRTQQANLLAQARLLANSAPVFSELPAPTSAYNQSTNMLPGISTRMIDAQGSVVLDLQAALLDDQRFSGVVPDLSQSTPTLISPAELRQRPEIVQALAGSEATAVREVPGSDGRRALYAAVPVLNNIGTVERLVYLSTPLPSVGWSVLPAEMRWQWLAASGVALLIASWVGWWLAVRIVRPLHQLAEAAAAVGRGDLQHHVPEDPSAAEMYALGQHFNAMTTNLRQVDQAKTAFIADVSHELRTPLTIIKGTVETLQDGAINDLHTRDSFLTLIGGETDRLIQLVNDLLVLTRANAGALRLDLQPLQLEELARSRLRHFRPLAERQQISLEISAARDLPCISADPQRLTQVLDNLLANAIRHTPTGGQIAIEVSANQQAVMCSVRDTGSGISPQHLPFIFDRFYRADASRNRQQGGAGLGLAISKALIEAQGGSISVASSLHQGTTFYFQLPLDANCQ
jgi:signal transduction histidine kinase